MLGALGMWNIRQILVALDLAEPAPSRALDHAVDLAAKHDAAVTVVYASNVPMRKYYPDGFEADRAEIERLVATEHARHVRISILQRDPAAPQAIVRAAEEIGADLIVMGTRGRTSLGRLVLGSVTESVIRSTELPVLIIRTGEAHTEQVLDAGL